MATKNELNRINALQKFSFSEPTMSLQLIKGVFNEILNDTVRQFTRSLRGKEAEHMSQQVQRVFEHCMGNGKSWRSCLALDTFRALRPAATSEELHRAAKISSSLELVRL